jgi:hypothetical protein
MPEEHIRAAIFETELVNNLGALGPCALWSYRFDRPSFTLTEGVAVSVNSTWRE